MFTGAVRAGWSRRAVLGAVGTGAVGAAASCSWFDTAGSDPPPPDPLAPLLAATRDLLVRYARTGAIHPELADRLAPLRHAHEQHTTALRQMVGLPEPAPPSPTSTSTAGPQVPADPDEAVEALREAEQDGVDRAEQACLDAPVERTMLLGSIYAARATHLEVLA